jgi:hypothetical protein
MINYFEAQNIPRKKKGSMCYGVIECKNLKESRKLFKLLDETMDWRFVEGVSMNGTKVTVTFFEKRKERKNGNSKKTLPNV